MKKILTILILLSLSLGLSGCITEKLITNFEDCANAGYPVMESYPRQCQTPDGRTFTEVIEDDVDPDEPIGGERDEHGCLGPAGYTWDEDIQACIRTWEIENESQRRAAKIVVEYVGPSEGLTVVQIDVARCPGCFVVHLDKYGERTEVSLANWEIVDGSGQEEFCGTSTQGQCESDSDCISGGCSGQICQSKNEEGVITTCEFRECYTASDYGLECGCMDNKCMWK